MKKHLVFTGGGTAGHIYPGLAVIEQLKTDSEQAALLDIAWIGSNSELEKDLLKEADLTYYGIPSGKFRRYFSFKNILDLFKIMAGMVAAFFLLKRLKPHLLFSKGGYVSVPPVLVARFLKIPVISHESDYDPGLATRINSRFSDILLTSYPDTQLFFRKELRENIFFVGNPVRQKVINGNGPKARKQFGIPEDKPFVLILGGSLGASQINSLVAPLMSKLTRRAFVVHQLGHKDFKESHDPDYRTYPFIKEDLPDIFAAADLIISRAGASTIGEISALGKPSILIPLDSGSRGDQIRNAENFQQTGAALVLRGRDLNSDMLMEQILKLIADKKKLRVMAQCALALGGAEASRKSADFIWRKLELSS